MKRKTIAIDLDDILAAHAESFVAFSNERYGTNLDIEIAEFGDHWDRLWQVEHDEVERRAAEFLVPEIVAAYSVKEEAQAALEKLKERYNLSVVTARMSHLDDITREWIERYFPTVFTSVHLVPVWEKNNRVTKLDVCRQINADYLIDDLAKHCNLVADNGIPAVLFGDYAWNRTSPISPGVTRCRDWKEVLLYFGL